MLNRGEEIVSVSTLKGNFDRRTKEQVCFGLQ